MEIMVALFAIIMIIIIKGIRNPPQQQAWIVESFGKFDRKLEPGLNVIIPFYQKVAYKHSLKEQAVEVPEQAGITRDNVTLTLDGILYVRITDPVAASYGVSNPIYAVQLLAQTTMRSEIGKLTLDKTFEERETLNANIVTAINLAAQNWGIQCMRYEIKNITPPTFLESEGKMQAQINAAEASKRETVLKAEGQQQQVVLNAQARKQEVVLQSEAAQIDQVNRANGEAQAIVAVATATGEGLRKVASAILEKGGTDAVALKIAEQYVDAFKGLARTSTTVLLPTNAGDAGSMVAQALSVFDSIRSKSATGSKS
jgi:regulator of protease activity HflC (stomatin/prohibitin superfamily)